MKTSKLLMCILLIAFITGNLIAQEKNEFFQDKSSEKEIVVYGHDDNRIEQLFNALDMLAANIKTEIKSVRNIKHTEKGDSSGFLLDQSTQKINQSFGNNLNIKSFIIKISSDTTINNVNELKNEYESNIISKFTPENKKYLYTKYVKENELNNIFDFHQKSLLVTEKNNKVDTIFFRIIHNNAIPELTEKKEETEKFINSIFNYLKNTGLEIEIYIPKKEEEKGAIKLKIARSDLEKILEESKKPEEKEGEK